jgi:hypothetical protein
MDGRHVDQESAGERDVAGDARTFLAERFLGDLHDDILTGFQHFADELRTARRAGMAVTTIVARTAGTAGTAFESWAGRTRAAITTAIGTAATAVGASTTAAITSTALRALETCARIAADAGGIAREIFARSGSAADARRARFAGEENDVVLDDGRARRGFGCVRFDDFGFGVLMVASFVLVVFVFRVFVFRVLVGDVFGIT